MGGEAEVIGAGTGAVTAATGAAASAPGSWAVSRLEQSAGYPYYGYGYGPYAAYGYDGYYDEGPVCYLRRHVVINRWGERIVRRVRVCE